LLARPCDGTLASAEALVERDGPEGTTKGLFLEGLENSRIPDVRAFRLFRNSSILIRLRSAAEPTTLRIRAVIPL
jgi:hypothetical protein